MELLLNIIKVNHCYKTEVNLSVAGDNTESNLWSIHRTLRVIEKEIERAAWEWARWPGWLPFLRKCRHRQKERNRRPWPSNSRLSNTICSLDSHSSDIHSLRIPKHLHIQVLRPHFLYRTPATVCTSELFFYDVVPDDKSRFFKVEISGNFAHPSRRMLTWSQTQWKHEHISKWHFFKFWPFLANEHWRRSIDGSLHGKARNKDDRSHRKLGTMERPHRNIRNYTRLCSWNSHLWNQRVGSSNTRTGCEVGQFLYELGKWVGKNSDLP